MKTANLDDVVAEQLDAARAAGSGRSTSTICGGAGRTLRQAVMALTAGRGLAEHESPAEATLQVLAGHVQLNAGAASWQGRAGDYLVIPDERHDLQALEDSVVILTVVTGA